MAYWLRWERSIEVEQRVWLVKGFDKKYIPPYGGGVRLEVE